jgi:hypothetical protein
MDPGPTRQRDVEAPRAVEVEKCVSLRAAMDKKRRNLSVTSLFFIAVVFELNLSKFNLEKLSFFLVANCQMSKCCASATHISK